MSTVIWIVIAVAAVLVIGVIVWASMSRRRTTSLREQFGPEYDRTVQEREDRRAAESELSERRTRREKLDIRPLDPAMRRRHMEQWQRVQSRFVDQPALALAEADELVVLVMHERGYPMRDFEQRAADISVDYPQVVEHYRAAHRVSSSLGANATSTEDMRQAVVHYRALFDELLNDETDTRDMREVR